MPGEGYTGDGVTHCHIRINTLYSYFSGFLDKMFK